MFHSNIRFFLRTAYILNINIHQNLALRLWSWCSTIFKRTLWPHNAELYSSRRLTCNVNRHALYMDTTVHLPTAIFMAAAPNLWCVLKWAPGYSQTKYFCLKVPINFFLICAWVRKPQNWLGKGLCLLYLMVIFMNYLSMRWQQRCQYAACATDKWWKKNTYGNGVFTSCFWQQAVVSNPVAPFTNMV